MILIEEIENRVVSELLKYIERIKPHMQKESGENSFLGDTTFFLGKLLENLLRNKFDDWNDGKWIDDGYISQFCKDNSSVMIWGVMIWGRDNTTAQWTDPFYFEIELLIAERKFKRYTFLFCDLDNGEISYEEFMKHRGYWIVMDRNWKYILNS